MTTPEKPTARELARELVVLCCSNSVRDATDQLESLIELARAEKALENQPEGIRMDDIGDRIQAVRVALARCEKLIPGL